ncbi:MAG: aminotransferase class I/II-fold pyridoxal phosphate-dependent enzyme, partial [Gammaproteobacteria bacterium]
IRMNSNAYLGMALREEVIAAEEHAARAYGAGPGAVRFISGTYGPHVELERRLAAFHGREAALVFSSAYATVMGVLPVLVTPDTAIISDALNHNCIINAARLAQPKEKYVYAHLDMAALEDCLTQAVGCERVLVVTDGIFSMRGDHAPLAEIKKIAARFDARFTEGVLMIVDDSHGVGAIGATGRGTEEHTGSGPVDLLIATLGKAFGVNGGYVAGERVLIEYLREKAPLYIYSNPITPGEAAAAVKALDIVDSPAGRGLLAGLRQSTLRFRQALINLGYETLAGEHPVVPLLLRDSARTRAMVQYLKTQGILATGLSYPVVPPGEEEIRFQISAAHTEADIDEVLAVLAAFPGRV